VSSVKARYWTGTRKSESRTTLSAGKPHTWGRTHGNNVINREMCMAITKAFESTDTKLERLKQRNAREQTSEMKWLMPFFSMEALATWFRGLDGKKASGIDRITKQEYGKDLAGNLSSLVARMKSLSYRPGAVREVLIPKGDGKSFRPLGIANLEDKLVQTGMAKVLESIYEPLFYDFSYGFRPKRSCHMAIKELSNTLYRHTIRSVIDVDLKNFFGMISHENLMDILRIKIKDEVFLRYISRTLKAGILRDGNFTVTDEGTPQGSPVSPVLANIFAHHVIDTWFVKMALPVMKGKVFMYRYADDIVICCELEYDAQRLLKGLKNRLEKFGLKLNEDKTKLVSFDRKGFSKSIRQGTFDFLGFTFYIGRSQGKQVPIPKLKTSRKRITAKLKRVSEWIKKNRNAGRLPQLWDTFRRKLAGHVQYYGISQNTWHVGSFLTQATKIFFKWINRRSQRRSINWSDFNIFVKANPLPKVRVVFSLF
jgi:RNA-directed DNA polymerase